MKGWEEDERPMRRRGMRPGPPLWVRGGGHGRGGRGHNWHEEGPTDEGPQWAAPPWAGMFGPAGLLRSGEGPWGRGGPGAGRPWGRARRGDVRSAIIALLSERPMHGYEIIGELAERTDGIWRPSPGSVYPTLQLLEDEGVVAAEGGEPGGKRRFVLTDEGARQAAELGKGPAPWEQFTSGAPAGAREMRHALRRLMPVVGQVMTAGNDRECSEAAKILEDARRSIYKVLAGEEPAPAPE